MKLGLIEGRHEMPVDGYILPACVTDEVGFHQGLFIRAKNTFLGVYSGQSITVYITGLTNAALGVMSAIEIIRSNKQFGIWRGGKFYNWNNQVVSFKFASYDRETDSYVEYEV